jgi:hypothetical protein
LGSLTVATGSPFTGVVLFQSAPVSVLERTTFMSSAISGRSAAAGVGQKAAIPS